MIANRLEEITNRQVDAELFGVRKAVATTEKTSAVGNAAKLRKAVAKIAAYEVPHNFQRERQDIVDACYDLTRAIRIANAALSAPARNCDKLTSYAEAKEAYKLYYRRFVARANNKFEYPLPFDEWLFAPEATEGDEK